MAQTDYSQNANIIKRVTANKSSLLLNIDFTKYTNITTKLNWKLFTKVIKKPSKEAWVLNRQCLN